MGTTDAWEAMQLPRRKTSWAASVGRQRSARLLVERAKPCEAVTGIKPSAFARRMLIDYPEDDTIKRVTDVIMMLIAPDAGAASKRMAPDTTRIIVRRQLSLRRLVAASLAQPPSTEERLRRAEARIQSLSAGINEMLQTMTSQTEAAIRLVQEHRAKWQGNVVLEKHK